MNAHTVTLDLYDQPGRLVAVDFETRRVLVQYGSGIESCISGYEYLAQDTYCCTHSPASCDRVERVRAGEHVFRLRMCSAPRPGQASDAPNGARDACPLSDYRLHRFTAYQGWSSRYHGERIKRMQKLGCCYDDLLCAPRVPIRSSAQDDRVELAGLVQWLRSVGVPAHVTCASARARAVAGWLDSMRKALMHGFELCELAQEHGASPLDGAALDGVIKPLVKAGVVRPYSFDPSYIAALGLRAHASNEQQSARSFALAIAGEMREAKMNRGEDYSGEEWAALCRSLGVLQLSPAKTGHTGAATGSIFWYFTQGEKFADMPSFVL